MNEKIITSFTNVEDNMTSFVCNYDGGRFSVTLKDNDSGEFIPSVKIFTNIDDAVKYAKTV